MAAPKKSYVYFLQAVCPGDARIKIGCSRLPMTRWLHAMAWSAFPLVKLAEVEGDRMTEQFLHRKFAAHRLHGEWFSSTPELVKLIEEARAIGRVPEWAGMIDMSWRTHEWKCRLNEILRDAGLTKADLADRLNVTVNTAAAYCSSEIPNFRVVEVLRFLRERGIEMTAHDLFIAPRKRAA